MCPVPSRTVSRRILRAVRVYLLLLTLTHLAVPLPTWAAEADDPVVWSIGKTDNSAIEFAPGSQLELTYKIGESNVSKDFSGHQDGTISWLPELSRENPYTIEFDLDQPPREAFHLELNYLYKNGPPTHIKLIVNDQKGIFPVRPVSTKANDSIDGNFILLAKQHLFVPLSASMLKQTGNRITIIPLGFGSMDYDSVVLRRGKAPAEKFIAEPQLRPTVFYTRRDGKLMETCQLLVPFRKAFDQGTATVHLGKAVLQVDLSSEDYHFGVLSHSLSIPAIEEPTETSIEVDLDGVTSSATHTFVPAKRWKLFFCPKVHNDVGYTDLQPHVNELDTRNTDTILSILSKFPFYKFNFETSWLVENYLDCRVDEVRNEFFERAQEGRASINAFYLNIMTGICTGEELYRAMYYTHRLHRQHGTNFDFACLTDAPSHSWFLPTLLNDVGIKGFSNGSNQGRAPILVHSDLNENSPFYWEGMNGERILMFYARTYAQWKMLTSQGFISPHASYDYLKGTIPQLLVRYQREDYVPDVVMIYGAYIDNAAIPETGEAEYIEKWNKEFAFPQFLVTTDAEYYDYIEEHYSDKLPVYRGDAGAYWEDGVASSTEATTWNRQTQQVLPVAETSASFASLFEPRYRYPTEDFRDAWKNLLFYDEHTWGAFNSTSQPDREGVHRQWEVKESYSRRANLDARTLLARSLNRLCQQITVDGNIILTFNWQNRVRSQYLETELNEGAYLVDLVTDESVPVDVILSKAGWQRVRFLAKDVPAMGYRGYAIRMLDPPSDSGEAEESAEPEEGDSLADSWTIENEYYQLVIDPETGGVKSLTDKAEQRELVDERSEYSLNQYLYVSGGDESLILNLDYSKELADLTVHVPTSAKLIENLSTPLGQRLTIETSAKNTPLVRSEYLLYDDAKRIDIVNTVQKDSIRDKEAVYFAFPFAARQPRFEYQIQNGWLRPNDDQLPGACREWFTPQNLVHLQDGEYSVAWSSPDAPLVTLVDINRGKWLTHLEITNGHLYCYVMNNYWWTNYRAEQGGDFRFRFSITSGNKLSREDLAEFDVDTQSPVLVYPYLATFSAGIVQRGRPLEASSGSLMQLNARNLQVVMLKQAEDGSGWILRLLETAGREGRATLELPFFPVQAAHLCNGVEVNQEPLSHTDHTVTIPYKPNRYTTVRLQLGEHVQ